MQNFQVTLRAESITIAKVHGQRLNDDIVGLWPFQVTEIGSAECVFPPSLALSRMDESRTQFVYTAECKVYVEATDAYRAGEAALRRILAPEAQEVMIRVYRLQSFAKVLAPYALTAFEVAAEKLRVDGFDASVESREGFPLILRVGDIHIAPDVSVADETFESHTQEVVYAALQSRKSDGDFVASTFPMNFSNNWEDPHHVMTAADVEWLEVDQIIEFVRYSNSEADAMDALAQAAPAECPI